MLTGESPFAAGTPHETQLRQVNQEPPQRPLAGLPKPVRAVIEKGLRKAPDLRYQSAGALADALERAVTVAAVDGLTQVDVLEVDGPFWALAAQMYFGPFSRVSLRWDRASN